MGKARKGNRTARKQTKAAGWENKLVKENAAVSNEPINFIMTDSTETLSLICWRKARRVELEGANQPERKCTCTIITVPFSFLDPIFCWLDSIA